MRLGIIIWSLVCSFCLLHAVSFMIEGNGDTAILFGTGFMVSLYLFIAKTVQYIKEDYPEQISIKLQQNTEDKD